MVASLGAEQTNKKHQKRVLQRFDRVRNFQPVPPQSISQLHFSRVLGGQHQLAGNLLQLGFAFRGDSEGEDEAPLESCPGDNVPKRRSSGTACLQAVHNVY